MLSLVANIRTKDGDFIRGTHCFLAKKAIKFDTFQMLVDSDIFSTAI